MKDKLFIIILTALFSMTTVTTANGKTSISESDTLSIDINGRQVQIKVSYPFDSNVNGIVMWCDGGMRDTFIANVAKRYYDVSATLRGAVLYAGYASVEYIDKNGMKCVNGSTFSDDDPKLQAEIMQKVVERVHKESRLSGKHVAIFAYDQGCLAAAMSYPLLKDDINKILLVSPMIDNSLSTIKLLRTKKANSEPVTYVVEDGLKAKVDSMNAVSSLDAEFSADILGMLMFDRQHVEPIDSIIKSCSTVEKASDAVKSYLMEQWQRESLSVHNYWQGQADAYCSYFSRSATSGRVRMLLMDLRGLYANIQCPVKAVYGADDSRLDVSGSMRMMTEALKSKGNTSVEVQVLDDYGHDLRRVDRYNRGTVSQSVINNIVKWLN
jgi:pimeloyl-ACP methyl ester carboxylesterase